MDKLNIIDEQGNIIGEDTRENIHSKGLLHREIHVWFYTPDHKIIFQHRAKDKDTFPDLLDATVGGHVEINSNFEETALKEMTEETGIVAKGNELKFLENTRKKRKDILTGKTNNAVRAIFIYKFTGNLSDLKTEKGESEGFEAWSIDQLEDISPEDKKKFISGLLNKEHLEMYRKMLAL